MATTPRGLGVLQIEPTDHCNLACRMCAPHAERWETVHGVPKGLMPMPLFQHIVDGLVADDCHFDHVILQWLGDPSLHPDLETMVAYAGRRLRGRIGHLRFDTNGLLLHPDRLDRLLALRDREVPLLVVFTVDAATSATYARVKGRDGLVRARRHIRHLLGARAEKGPVNVQVQFVVQPGNAHEAGEFLRYWTGALSCHGAGHGVGEILFKRLSVGGGGAGQAAADALYDRTLRDAGIEPGTSGAVTVSTWTDRPWQKDDAHASRGPCPGPWLTPVVRHDGHLLMCCADLGSELDLGTLDQSRFLELWHGERATRLRLDHLAGRFRGVCAACGGVNWYALGPSHAADARRRAAELGIAS